MGLVSFRGFAGGRQLESFLQREVRGRLVRTSRTKGGDHASEKIRATYRVLSSHKIGRNQSLPKRPQNQLLAK